VERRLLSRALAVVAPDKARKLLQPELSSSDRISVPSPPMQRRFRRPSGRNGWRCWRMPTRMFGRVR